MKYELFHFSRKVMGNGHCTTTDGRECVFPFRYHGKLYQTCTNYAWNVSNALWCGTTYEVTDHSATYGACSSSCQPKQGMSAPNSKWNYSHNIAMVETFSHC